MDPYSCGGLDMTYLDMLSTLLELGSQLSFEIEIGQHVLLSSLPTESLFCYHIISFTEQDSKLDIRAFFTQRFVNFSKYFVLFLIDWTKMF